MSVVPENKVPSVLEPYCARDATNKVPCYKVHSVFAICGHCDTITLLLDTFQLYMQDLICQHVASSLGTVQRCLDGSFVLRNKHLSHESICHSRIDQDLSVNLPRFN